MTAASVVVSDGTRLHVETAGAGPDVVVLHGYMGSTGSMRPVVEALRGRNRVIAIDLPGHGRSDAPADVLRYSAEALQGDLKEVLRQRSIDRPSLVGYSMGGRLALGYAVAHPNAVRSVAVIGAGTGIEDEDARRRRTAADEALARMVETRGVEAFVDHWMALPLIADQAEAGTDQWLADRARRLATSPEGLTGMLRGFGQGVMPPLRRQLVHFALPLLMIAGSRDTNYLETARRTASSNDRVEVAVMDGAGHAPHITHPEQVAAALRMFLDGVAA